MPEDQYWFRLMGQRTVFESPVSAQLVSVSVMQLVATCFVEQATVVICSGFCLGSGACWRLSRIPE
jgi:hypothetical protein